MPPITDDNNNLLILTFLFRVTDTVKSNKKSYIKFKINNKSR